jgi:hypothetical protein
VVYVNFSKGVWSRGSAPLEDRFSDVSSERRLGVSLIIKALQFFGRLTELFQLGLICRPVAMEA